MKPEEQKILLSVLQKAGTDEYESKAYLALLSFGYATVQQIARRANLNRASCYAVLDRLSKKGLVGRVKKQGKNYLVPVSPERILEIQKENTKTIEKHIQSLTKILPSVKSEPNVSIFEGKAGLKSVLSMILNEAKEVCIFGDGDAFKKAIPGWTERYAKERQTRKIKSKLILKDTEGAKLSARRVLNRTTEEHTLTSIRLLPGAYTIVGGFDTYNDKVIFYSFEENAVAIVIESHIIATLAKTIFDILWNVAENYNNTLIR